MPQPIVNAVWKITSLILLTTDRYWFPPVVVPLVQARLPTPLTHLLVTMQLRRDHGDLKSAKPPLAGAVAAHGQSH